MLVVLSFKHIGFYITTDEVKIQKSFKSYDAISVNYKLYSKARPGLGNALQSKDLILNTEKIKK